MKSHWRDQKEAQRVYMFGLSFLPFLISMIELYKELFLKVIDIIYRLSIFNHFSFPTV